MVLIYVLVPEHTCIYEEDVHALTVQGFLISPPASVWAFVKAILKAYHMIEMSVHSNSLIVMCIRINLRRFASFCAYMCVVKR